MFLFNCEKLDFYTYAFYFCYKLVDEIEMDSSNNNTIFFQKKKGSMYAFFNSVKWAAYFFSTWTVVFEIFEGGKKTFLCRLILLLKGRKWVHII